MSANLFVRTLSVSTFLLLSNACSMTQSQKYSAPQQQESLNRWHLCIERHRDAHVGPLQDMKRDLSLNCAGHQRDVLATYPEYLENQVSVLLSEHADTMAEKHFLRSRNVKVLDTPQGADSDSLTLRLTDALSDDL